MLPNKIPASSSAEHSRRPSVVVTTASSQIAGITQVSVSTASIATNSTSFVSQTLHPQRLPAHGIFDTSSFAPSLLADSPRLSPISRFMLGHQMLNEQGLASMVANPDVFYANFTPNSFLAAALFPTNAVNPAFPMLPSVTAQTRNDFQANPVLRATQEQLLDLALARFGLRRKDNQILALSNIMQRPYFWLSGQGEQERALLLQMAKSLKLLGNKELGKNLERAVKGLWAEKQNQAASKVTRFIKKAAKGKFDEKIYSQAVKSYFVDNEKPMLIKQLFLMSKTALPQESKTTLISKTDKYGEALLVEAVNRGDVEVVKFIIDISGFDLTLANAALILACQKGDEQIVKMLLKDIAKLNTDEQIHLLTTANNIRQWPVLMAFEKAPIKLVSWLLKLISKLDEKVQLNVFASDHMAISKSALFSELVKRADPSLIAQYLQQVFSLKESAQLALFLKRRLQKEVEVVCADPFLLKRIFSAFEPIDEAVKVVIIAYLAKAALSVKEEVDEKLQQLIFDAVLQIKSSDLRFKLINDLKSESESDYFSLFYPYKHKNIQAIASRLAFIAQLDANSQLELFNEKNLSRETILHHAIRNGDLIVANLLLDYIEKLDQKQQSSILLAWNDSSENILFSAVKNQQPQIVERIMGIMKTWKTFKLVQILDSVDKRDEFLFYAAVKTENASIIQSIIHDGILLLPEHEIYQILHRIFDDETVIKLAKRTKQNELAAMLEALVAKVERK